ncbi:MAG: mechanosensitive ion channel family protein [Gemmatimonadales bacterium]|nr:MAG: mechanosensitive ion channel family protein [Gemmatimonadales bacterium]
MNLNELTEIVLILAVGALAGLLLYGVLILVLRYVVRPHHPALVESLRLRADTPAALFLITLGAHLALSLASPRAFPDGHPDGLGRFLVILSLAALGFLLIRLVRVLEDHLLAAVQMDMADNLRARRFHTQFRILRQALTVAILVLVAASILLQFDGFRQFGGGLLASAGVAGIIIGFAAQRALGNLLAGFQIAVTQPIRLDDVVVVEGEWGRVEEITLTYVIIRIWDERRLVLPIIYFLEKPFTNWTRRTADILGTVFLHVDYDAPLGAIRAQVRELVEGHPAWDGRVAEVVVTDALPTTLELRALVSSRDSGSAWDLRCHVREGLVTFLKEHYPDALPRFRIEQDPHLTDR